MLSVMPLEIVAQAVSVALRIASSSVFPDALAQFVRPWNVTQTSQETCRRSSVEATSRPSTANPKRIETRAVFDIV